jgi:hypothetical protein
MRLGYCNEDHGDRHQHHQKENKLFGFAAQIEYDARPASPGLGTDVTLVLPPPRGPPVEVTAGSGALVDTTRIPTSPRTS